MERDTTKHVGEERLEAYAMNSLAEDEVAIVEEHLLVCVTCQDQLAAVEQYGRAMQGAAKRIREEEAAAPVTPGAWEKVRAWFHTPIPIFAGVLAVASVILMVGLNLDQKPGPPVEVELQAIRGETGTTALAGHALHLRLDNRGIPDLATWPIEIVDQVGNKVWTGTGTRSDTAILATVDQSFKQGTYFVRLLKDGDEPVREYQLIVRSAVR